MRSLDWIIESNKKAAAAVRIANKSQLVDSAAQLAVAAHTALTVLNGLGHAPGGKDRCGLRDALKAAGVAVDTTGFVGDGAPVTGLVEPSNPLNRVHGRLSADGRSIENA